MVTEMKCDTQEIQNCIYSRVYFIAKHLKLPTNRTKHFTIEKIKPTFIPQQLKHSRDFK